MRLSKRLELESSMRPSFLIGTAMLALGAWPVPVYAQQAAQSQPITVVGPQQTKKAPDLNEVVCEKEQDTSSRLISNKVCMTRGQWAEQRRLERMEIDKAQTQRPAH
jgi:ABC-type nitrate/sulfonate/bicarbonate transport system substrate-binding protein